MTDSDNPVWNYVGIIEVKINRPAKDVWTYFFGKKERLWTEVDYTHIAGETGKVGEIYMQRVPGGQFLYEAVKVLSPRRLVLKITYREADAAERRLVGYDFQTITEVDGQAIVTLEQGLALPISTLPLDTRRAFALSDNASGDFKAATEKQDKNLTRIFENLKRIVEAEAHQ